MANTRFEYVRKFETTTISLLNCWTVVRVDGRCFHKFSEEHNYDRPNDARGLNLMTKCAKHIMSQFSDIVCAYGQSDEYSRKFTSYQRRCDKLISLISSLMASSFVFYWSIYFPNEILKYPPSFDGRCISYPSYENIRDYLSWRQADCHINNLYNTCFWMLVLRGNKDRSEAEIILRGTVSSDKNELLFSQFQLNYNNIEPLFRKGTFLVRTHLLELDYIEKIKEIYFIDNYDKRNKRIIALNEDIIGDEFWKMNPKVLE